MSSTRLQQQIILSIKQQANNWLWSKDLSSVTNIAKLTNSVDQLKLTPEDAAELEAILKGLYYFVRRFD